MPVRPDMMRSALRRVVLTLALVAAPVAMASTPADKTTLHDGVAALLAAVSDPANDGVRASDLIAQAGLTALTVPVTPPGPIMSGGQPVRMGDPVEIQLLDVRLAMTLVTQTAGAEDTFAVLTAQGPSKTEALVIRKGDATLADIRQFLLRNRLHDPSDTGEPVIRVPIVIWDGASLTVGPGETMNLSRPDGAFVVNFGHLTVNGATVASVGGRNLLLPRYAPFVLSSGSGSVQVSGSTFIGLGFGNTMKFGGFSIMRNNLMVVRNRSFIRDSLFQRVVSVAVNAADDFLIEGNRFHESRGAAIILTRSARARILGNVFSGEAPFNALRVLERSVDSVVSGNIVLGGQKSGIVVRDKSHRPFVANNIVWNRVGGGITVDRSDCGIVQGNHILENRQKGIEVRGSAGTVVRENHVTANESAGIWVSAQADDARTWVLDNVLEANSSGLATATAAGIVMVGNDFSRQFPRFLGGDIARQSRHIATNLDGAVSLMLTSAGVADAPSREPTCDR